MNDNITLPREVVQEALEALIEARALLYDGRKQDKAATALRTALAAEPTKPEPVPLAKDCPEDWPKDWLNMTLRVNSGDRVLSIESSLHLSEIKQSRGLAVQLAADTAWRQLDAAMKEDKT